MFDWITKKELEPDSIDTHITELWKCHNRLLKQVADMSELMKQLALATQEIRHDLDFLGAHMAKLSEQQTKLASLVMDQEYTNTHSTSIH